MVPFQGEVAPRIRHQTEPNRGSCPARPVAQYSWETRAPDTLPIRPCSGLIRQRYAGVFLGGEAKSEGQTKKRRLGCGWSHHAVTVESLLDADDVLLTMSL